MKWFKHYSDASKGETLEKIFRKYGLEGEARYWRLVELLAYRYDGNGDSFGFSLETIRQSLRHRSLTDCRLFLDHLTTFSTMKVEYSGNDCLIKYDKIMKIKDNHHKNLPVSSKELASNLPLDKIRIDKKRRDKKRIKENIKEKLPLNNSPLEALNFTDPEIITWLREGSLPLQEKLLKKYDEDYLAATIEKAFYWQSENKKRQAGTFLSSWIERDNNKRLKGNLSEADYNLKALFEDAAARVVTIDYGDGFKKNN